LAGFFCQPALDDERGSNPHHPREALTKPTQRANFQPLDGEGRKT
ncbi:MAG: hypothetical protein FD165_2780, partial [Gammaproteobacteria bacterium]